MLNFFISHLGIIGIIILVIVFLAILASGYVKAPTDTAFIISGPRKQPKVLIGQAGIKIPFIERKDELLLKQISIDIKTNGYIPTEDFIGVDIDAVAKVRLLTALDINEEKGITQEMVNAAMKNFLNMNSDQIREALTDSLQGNMREIIGTQSLQKLCNDRKAFGDEVQAKAQKDMNALGVYIESCNIQKLEDEKNLINALGQDNMSQIQKNASIAKANADKEIAIAQAEAAKAANDAKVLSETDIASKQNDLKIKKAELKKQADIKQAEADAAYEIQKETQRKTIEITKTEADIAKQDKEIELKSKEAEVKEQELSASIKKQADADKYRKQAEAEADLYQRQKEAEARRIEIQQAAEADKYKIEKQAEAVKVKAEADLMAKQKEAEGISAIGKAEAEAIQAKLLAEAEGLDKKAEAMNKMQQASIVEIVMDKLPEIVKNAAEPLSNVDSITMYGDGNSSKMVEDIMKTSSQIIDGIQGSTGLDIKALLAGALGGKLLNNKDVIVNVDTNKEETEN